MRVSDGLELELRTVVSCHMGAGNRTLVLWIRDYMAYKTENIYSLAPNLGKQLIFALFIYYYYYCYRDLGLSLSL